MVPAVVASEWSLRTYLSVVDPTKPKSPGDDERGSKGMSIADSYIRKTIVVSCASAGKE